MEKQILTVTEINKYIKTLMDHDMILYNLCLRGEISNYRPHSSGHMYLTLKDKNSTIQAVMFKSDNIKLKFEPENGMEVMVFGRISVYERSGQYQIYISDMQPYGVGSLHIAFEQLKAKLMSEGLFDEKRKKGIPEFPEQIGIITSPTGAAIRDILNIASRRCPGIKILIYPVSVQGDSASKGIIEGVNFFNDKKNVDVIIIGRGGGSIEDLWAFNDEALARSVAESKIPIVSAVGHEIDFTILDFVSDLRAPTPSAAAELVVPSKFELNDKILNAEQRMLKSLNGKLELLNLKLVNYNDSIGFNNPLKYIEDFRIHIDTIDKTMYDIIKNNSLKKLNELSALCGSLNALSPLSILSRGYGMIKNKDDKILRSVKNVKNEDTINIILRDGELTCTVEGVETYEKQRKI
jgi:exodeoxyribonuclease VII large subunit